LNFLNKFSKNTQTNLIKIRQVEIELFRVEGWTDRSEEANRRFSQFL